ncbi:hypothetical protein Tco_0984650 [Tanacetum coccineum]
METIHVKFDELTAMASEHDSLEPVSQRFLNNDSSSESMNTLSEEDLDNLRRSLSICLSIPLHNKFIIKKTQDLTELDGNTLLTPYDAPDFSEAESSTNLDPSNMHESTKYNPQYTFRQKHIL